MKRENIDVRKSLIALFAATALVASGPIAAQSRAEAAPAPARTGAQMDDDSELRGRGIILPTLAIIGVVLLILKLTDTWPFDDEDSVSP